jgi:hypothetical protein
VIPRPAGPGEGLCLYPAVVLDERRGAEIDLRKVVPLGPPLVAYRDIVWVDTARHVWKLAFPRDSLARAFRRGIGAFAVRLDSTPVFAGWFWSCAMSSNCETFVITPDCDWGVLNEDELWIDTAYPPGGSKPDPDPRNDPGIVRRLLMDGKIRHCACGAK